MSGGKRLYTANAHLRFGLAMGASMAFETAAETGEKRGVSPARQARVG
jgi:surfactin synthase thioesterase subunit